MEILIDFDGTCVEHKFPNIGKDIGAIPVLKDLVKAGHRLILFTMRSDTKKVIVPLNSNIIPKADRYLTYAVEWFSKNNIPLYGIQTNPTQCLWTDSPKAYGHLLIDDSALGCPLIYPENGNKPYVDWVAVRKELERLHYLSPNSSGNKDLA